MYILLQNTSMDIGMLETGDFIAQNNHTLGFQKSNVHYKETIRISSPC